MAAWSDDVHCGARQDHQELADAQCEESVAILSLVLLNGPAAGDYTLVVTAKPQRAPATRRADSHSLIAKRRNGSRHLSASRDHRWYEQSGRSHHPTLDRDLCFAASGRPDRAGHIVSAINRWRAPPRMPASNLAQPEDVAQETFVIAWRKLTSLREPDQLRAWLCGIARTLAKNAQRRSARRGGEAVALTAIAEPDAPGLSPLETAIARDEAAMLNRALASVPESSREVLVLFYREEQSVAAVAERLGLASAVG
jgi:RNA polymerase sigma factor (sigma-70 family)